MTAVMLAAPLPADRPSVPGVPVDAVRPRDGRPLPADQAVFFLADETVRRWIRHREEEGTPVLITDDGWQAPAALNGRILIIPIDERDQLRVAAARGRWTETHYRDERGLWRPRHDTLGGPHDDPPAEPLAWDDRDGRWLASAPARTYLISTGPDSTCRLTRWGASQANSPIGCAQQVLDMSLIVPDVATAQKIAQAYEDGRSIAGRPTWQHPGSTKPPLVIGPLVDNDE